MKKQIWMNRISVLFLVSIVSAAVRAQGDVTGQIPTSALTQADKKKLGWTPTGVIGINAAVSSASNVVGQTEGSSETYGLNAKGTETLIAPLQEWQNALSYVGTATRTADETRYVKSGDLLKAETLYLYTLPQLQDFGPYVQASAEAPIFFGEDVRQTQSHYTVQHRDGTTTQAFSDTLRLTDGFMPWTTKESVGGFWKAVDQTGLRLDARLGVGAQQILADGQYAVAGTNSDGSVSVVELRTLAQIGAEAALTGKGKIDDAATWEAGIETLTPFINNKNANDGRDPVRLTDVEGYGKLSSKITSWASFSYSYKLEIKPQLIDATQQTHLASLNLNYDFL